MPFSYIYDWCALPNSPTRAVPTGSTVNWSYLKQTLRQVILYELYHCVRYYTVSFVFIRVSVSIFLLSTHFDIHAARNVIIYRLVCGKVIPMGIQREMSHGMGWDRHKLLWEGNGTEKMSHEQPWLYNSNVDMAVITAVMMIYLYVLLLLYFCFKWVKFELDTHKSNLIWVQTFCVELNPQTFTTIWNVFLKFIFSHGVPNFFKDQRRYSEKK